jgi:hypothetical protein
VLFHVTPSEDPRNVGERLVDARNAEAHRVQSVVTFDTYTEGPVLDGVRKCESCGRDCIFLHAVHDSYVKRTPSAPVEPSPDCSVACGYERR